MSDIVAQIEVLAKESGCLIDISAILDLAVCPKVDIITEKPHVVEEKDDYVCITPTEPAKPKEKRCAKKTCYEVQEPVCRKPTVALDLQILVILGLLTEEELEQYLKTTGALREDEQLVVEDDQTRIDPWLSQWPSPRNDDGDNLLDLEVGGDDGLVTLDLLGKKNLLVLGGKDGKLLDVNLRRRNGGLPGGFPGGKGGKPKDRLLDVDIIGEKDRDEALIDVDVLTQSPHHYRRHRSQNNKLIDADIIGEKDEHEAPIDIDILTQSPHHYRRHGPPKNNKLIDVDIIGEKDKQEAPIDVDVLTHSRLLRRAACKECGNGNNGNGWGNRPWGHSGWEKPSKPTDKLLDVDLIGEKDKNEALIDVDVLTHSRRGKPTDKLLDVDVIGEKDKKEALIDVDVLTTSPKDRNNVIVPGRPQPGHPGHYTGGFLTHYQPICKKGFRTGHRDNAEKCHARDVNHCLAICHSRAALLTIEAGVKAGDLANALLCAAVEFDKSVDGENCRYFVAPESKPCHDDELVENENCVSFIRN